MRFTVKKSLTSLCAAVIAVGMSVAVVDAKPGRGGSAGSRGAKTDTSVPSTPTAPRTTSPAAAPGSTMPGRPAAPAAAAAAQAAKPSMMSTMAKGFAMGLIGAGLFGLLTGSGLFGGLSGIMGFLGLLLQIALIALAARLIWGFFRNRQQTQTAAAGPAALGRIGMNQPQMPAGAPSSNQAHASQAQAHQSQQPVAPERRDTVGIGPDDYSAFQATLTGVMAAYSAEDLAGLRRVATPEMAAHYIRELHENQSKGLINRVGQPELRQGDLAEAWYEDNTAYATVAMRFAMTDVTMERTSGRIVSGNPSVAEESVEIWTFRRDGAGQPWLVSAVEQA